MRITAHAKINLFLEVLGKRSDGYHEIDTVLQTIGLGDDLFLEKNNINDCNIEIKGADDISPGKDNLVWKAWNLLRGRFPDKTGGVNVKLVKRVPPGAGLGGGSADAAAMLCGLNGLFSLNLGRKDLEKLGTHIGMDVPFLIRGGTARATGRGENLEFLERKTEFSIIVVHPGFPTSTPEAYRGLAGNLDAPKHDSEKMIRALSVEKVDALTDALYNRFEKLLTGQNQAFAEIKKVLLKEGCKAAMITGSGSAICGFAPADADLSHVVGRLAKRYYFTALTRPVQQGVVIHNNAE